MSGKGFDTRKLMTGKDGKLFITLDGVSIWFASVEEFSIGMNVSNVDFHPAGDVQTYGVPDSVKFTASFTEAVVRDDLGCNQKWEISYFFSPRWCNRTTGRWGKQILTG